MSDSWVALDKSLARTMKEINRPFSYVEAMFSHSLNVNCGRAWSIKGYSEAWQWDRKKVRKFIEEIVTDEGYMACKKGMSTGYKIRLIDLKSNGTEQGHNGDTIGTEQGHAICNENNGLQWNGDTIGTEQGHNGDTTRDPIIKNKKDNKKKNKEYTPDFLEFYETYPRKEKKYDAFRSWDKATKTVDPKTIMAALLSQNELKWRMTEEKFIPLPASWLNGKRWEDSIAQKGKEPAPEDYAARQIAETRRKLAELE